MERLDYYDIIPRGMDAYLSHHGHHFSKSMYEWAVDMMKSRDDKKVSTIQKKEFEDICRAYGVTIERKDGYYDALYVWCMGKSDFLKSSIMDEHHLALFVKDYIDDKDGSPTRAFDEFYIKCVSTGVDIPWEDMI